jgi:hypothetical protein
VHACCAQVLGDAKRNRSEALAEAVPEALKNALLVMAAQGLLTPAWTVRPVSFSCSLQLLHAKNQHLLLMRRV